MKEQILNAEVLVCPYCVKQNSGNNIKLQLINKRTEGDDIKEGGLLCNNCSRSYPIIEGIAIFPSTQGATEYEQMAAAESYIPSQYRDLLATDQDLSAKLKSYDATGFFLEPLTGKLSPPANDYYSDLVKLLGERVTADSLALDLGCSVGRLSRMLARKARFVIGVDLSFTKIKIARELLLTGYASINLGRSKVSSSGIKGEEVSIKLEEKEQSNLDFIVADASLLPFRDAIFDVICTSSVIDRVPDAEDFIKNIEKVAHDGTTLLITSPFDWSDKFTPKENWLGFKAFGTSEGASEEALKELLRRHHFRPLEKKEQDITWATFRDTRHHSVWSVYSAVFENYRYSIKRLNPQDGIPESLIEAYQQIFKEDPAFREIISHEVARDAFVGMEFLLIAERQSDGHPIGFAGGRNMSAEVLATDNQSSRTGDQEEATYQTEVAKSQTAAHQVLKGLGNDRIFFINELGVVKEYEGAGIGGSLLDTLIGHAKANGYHGFALVTSYKDNKAISLYRRRNFSFLSNHDGLLRRPVQGLRVSGKEERDLRPYLYRVDEFNRIPKLKNGKEAFLELIRPASMRPDSFEPIAQQISELFGRAFWGSDDPLKRWRVDKILLRFPKIDLMILAFDESHEAIGYSMFTRLTWREDSILFVNAIALSGGSPKHPEDWQKSGLGSIILREAIRQLPCKTLAARTQNPAFVSMLRKLKPQQILPFDNVYQSDTLELLDALNLQVSDLRDGKRGSSPGIYKHVYREGLLGDYETKLSHERLNQFDETMTKLDPTWSRKQGDALIPVATGIPGVDDTLTAESKEPTAD